jgi:hypothetical protein
MKWKLDMVLLKSLNWSNNKQSSTSMYDTTRLIYYIISFNAENPNYIILQNWSKIRGEILRPCLKLTTVQELVR